MWRKALVLGLVLMAVGMVIDGAVAEKAEIGAIKRHFAKKMYNYYMD